MDFWNRKKIEELESKLRIAESREIELELKIEKLKLQIRGERVCDGYCKNCKHAIPTPNTDIFAGVICYTYQCVLDCKCKDFERKEQTLLDRYDAQAEKTWKHTSKIFGACSANKRR